MYLCRHEYIVYTDHKPLTEQFYLRDVHNRRYRWLTYLEESGAKVVHVKGKDNVIADFISRNIHETPLYKMVNFGAIEFHSLLHDNDEITTKQRNDDQLCHVHNYLTTPNEINKGEVNRIYRKYLDKLALNSDNVIVFKVGVNEKLVPPRSFRAEIINICHNSFLAGHQGVYLS